MEDLNTFLLKKSIGRIKYTQSQLRQPGQINQEYDSLSH